MPVRETYTTKDGTALTLGAVSVQQMLVRKQIPPQMLRDAQAAALDGTAEELLLSGGFAGLYDAVIAAGVIEPVIDFGDRAQTPAGAVHVMDLGDDYVPVANRILALSGLTKEAEEATRFRDGVGDGGDVARPVGAEAVAG